MIVRDNEIVLTGARRVHGETGSFVFGAARDVFITGNRYVAPQSLGAFNPCIKGDVPGLVVEGNTVATLVETSEISGDRPNETVMKRHLEHQIRERKEKSE